MTFTTSESSPVGPILLVWESDGLHPPRFVRAEIALLAVVRIMGDEWPNVRARALKAALELELRQERESEWRRDAKEGDES